MKENKSPRQFKFRVWDKKSNCWLKGLHYLSLDGSGIVYNYKDIDLGILGADIGEFIIQQYIGIKDIKGREIFEGDIIRATICGAKVPDPMTVVFCERNLSFGMKTKYMTPIFSMAESEILVIGNILENSELIKEVKKRVPVTRVYQERI